jgi:hypothetical protein
MPAGFGTPEYMIQRRQGQQPPPPAAAGGGQMPNQSGRWNRDPGMEMSRLLDLMEQMRAQYQTSMQDVSLQPNQQDIELMQAMQQATLDPQLAQISGAAGARGITGSSIEGVERGQLRAQSALQGQQFLQDQSFRRAGFELTRNQQLFNSLIGATQTQYGNSAALFQQGQEKQGGGGWLGRLGRGVLGAGIGLATGGPAGALKGGAAALGLGTSLQQQQTPSYYNYNQADFSSQNPLEWYGPSSIRP